MNVCLGLGILTVPAWSQWFTASTSRCTSGMSVSRTMYRRTSGSPIVANLHIFGLEPLTLPRPVHRHHHLFSEYSCPTSSLLLREGRPQCTDLAAEPRHTCPGGDWCRQRDTSKCKGRWRRQCITSWSILGTSVHDKGITVLWGECVQTSVPHSTSREAYRYELRALCQMLWVH